MNSTIIYYSWCFCYGRRTNCHEDCHYGSCCDW